MRDVATHQGPAQGNRATRRRSSTDRDHRSSPSLPWSGVSTQDQLELLANVPSRGPFGKPLRSHYRENLISMIEWLRRRGAVEGPNIRTTYRQAHIGRGGDDFGTVAATHDHAYTSLRRYLDVLQEAGLIRWQGQPGGGGGLYIQLTDPRLDSDVRARSSAGWSYVTCETRRRAETPEERRQRQHRPRRRRKGAPPRYDVVWGTGPLSLFHPEKVVYPYGESAPMGADSSTAQHTGARARAERSDGVESSANVVQGSAESPSWEGGQALALLERRLAMLVADVRVEPSLGPSRAWAMFTATFGRSRRLSRWRWSRLGADLRRLDRYGGKGAGVDVLKQLLLAQLEEAWGGGVRPLSLAWFLRDLRRTGRKWRRDHDPERRRKSEEFRRSRRRPDLYEAQGYELRRGRKDRR